MSILSIKRDYGINPSIVRMTVDNTLEELTTPGYLFREKASLAEINEGAFQWNDTDYVLIYYSGTWGFFTYNQDDDYFDSAPLPLIAGSGITITHSAEGTEIASTDAGENWTVVTGTTQAAESGMGYICSNAGQTTVTLPAIAPAGSLVSIAGLGAGGWVLETSAGDTFQTAIGSGTTITSGSQYDTITALCIVANTTWSILASSTTGFTIA